MHDRSIVAVPMISRMAVSLLLLAALLASPGCGDLKDQGDPGPLLALLKCAGSCAAASVNTEFSNPLRVTISGYTGDAMEPFITRAGTTYLFFNSLNAGGNTSLYYASRDSDTAFTFIGAINGVNGIPPHLDAVASMDTSNKFYFISTRDWPIEIRNVYTGIFAAGTVTPNPPLSLNGDFYISNPGWIVMDGEINPNGDDFYFVNAHFSGGAFPDQSDIGIAHNTAGTFNKIADNATIMANVNTDKCLEYAPCIRDGGLELFFTRLDPCKLSSEILVSTRAATTDPFGEPARISAISGFAEAPSLSADGKTLYYHVKKYDVMQKKIVFVIFKVSR